MSPVTTWLRPLTTLGVTMQVHRMRSHIMPIHRDFWLFGAMSDKYVEYVELRHKEPKK